MMRQILISILLISVLSSSASNAENKSTLHGASTQIRKSPATKAPSGFYLEIKRSYVRAYSGWQKKTITLLKLKGFAAFNGEPMNRVSAGKISNMESLEKTSRPKLIISSVYVGPYRSSAAAERMIPALLSALKPLIDAEKKDYELNNRYLFLVGVVRVK